MRVRLARFLREIGLDPSRSTSRSPLESPWRVAQVSDLRKGQAESPSYQAAREETSALTEQIEQVEKEINERVEGLY